MIQERWNEVDITAYLDGQLAPRQIAAFEKSLVQNSVLRQRVDALRKTLALLHETPLRESPRNYLLTPSMVANPKQAQPPRRRSVGIMRLATSLTAAAFVLTMGLNVLTRGLAPAVVMERGESLEVMQKDEVIIQEAEAPALMLAVATPTWETEDTQEKSFIVEEPVEELDSEAPLPEGEMKVAPVSDIEDEETIGVAGGEERSEALEAPESPDTLEKSDAFDAVEEVVEKVEPEQALVGVATDDIVRSEQASDEGNDIQPTEDLGAGEVTLAATPEELRTLVPPAEEGDGAPQDMHRQLAQFTLPQWVPISLGIITLILLGVTLLIPARRQ